MSDDDVDRGGGAPDDCSGEPRVQAVLDVLLQLAGADLSARVPDVGGDSPIDLVAAAVNMLGEELEAATLTEAKLRAELEEENRMRREELEQLARAQEAIRELSTPVIEIWRGVLILPLIGVIDEARGQQIMEQLLTAVVRTGANTVILDITGVPEIDTSVADRLLKAMAASELLGTNSILTGVSPANAQTLVRLGVDFEHVDTARTLEAGLRRALLRQQR